MITHATGGHASSDLASPTAPETCKETHTQDGAGSSNNVGTPTNSQGSSHAEHGPHTQHQAGSCQTASASGVLLRATSSVTSFSLNGPGPGSLASFGRDEKAVSVHVCAYMYIYIRTRMHACMWTLCARGRRPGW
jgi:hypothetical protein